ncbi:MAG: cysteine desulfurase family protein [Tractidigestivibacter sp.]|uniref:cysteine desulfurase family protein n=1 Tax=Tractidigestivibacter sp. TaxID=2847320 RepID=UPI003D8D4432
MSDKDFIYLDYAASAPAREESLAAERAYEQSPIAGANPNSLHSLGREAARQLDGARRDLARLVGGRFRPSDVIFTSGGTESNNLALIGLAEGARGRDRKRRRIVVSAIEHDSVLDLTGVLHDLGFDVTPVSPDRDGRVSASALEHALGPDVALVSIMSANNETGVVQPVAELARASHKAGAVFHTDAVQAFGRIPLDVADADAVSIAAHKIGGPVGIGALLVRGRVPLRPLSYGGGQEAGRRAGTQDVRGALAFAAAAKASCADLAQTRALVAGRANRLYQRICAPGTGIVPTTSAVVDEGRLPGMVSVMAQGVDSESLVLGLDDAGFEVSAGSACSSASLDASHVLTAMGIPRTLALGSLRISFDERVSQESLDAFADALLDLVAKRTGRAK